MDKIPSDRQYFPYSRMVNLDMSKLSVSYQTFLQNMHACNSFQCDLRDAPDLPSIVDTGIFNWNLLIWSHNAILNNRLDTVLSLFKHGNVHLNLIDQDGNTTLNLALKVSHSRHEIVEAILQSGHSLTFYQKNNIEHPLLVLCKTKCSLYEASCNENCLENRLHKLDHILKVDKNANISNKHGSTPLHYASQFNSDKFIDLLIAHNADVNSKDLDGITPLMIAVRSDCLCSVETLLYYKAAINAVDSFGHTVLSRARSLQMVKLLIENNVDFDVELHNELSVVKFLLYETLPVENYEWREYVFKYFLLSERQKGTFLKTASIYHPSIEIQFHLLDTILRSDINFDYINDSSIWIDKPIAPVEILLDYYDFCAKDESIWEHYRSLFELLMSKGGEIYTNSMLINKLYERVFVSKYHYKIFDLLDILISYGFNIDFYLPDYSKIVPYIFYFINMYVNYALFRMMHYTIAVEPWQVVEFFFDSDSPITDSKFNDPELYNNLQALCRIKIRKILKINCKNTCQFFSAVKNLPLPQMLKNYIRYM